VFYNSFDDTTLTRLLSFLKSHSTEYLSGQDLSDVLKISRVAVWKHVKTIRRLGYNIETRQRLGYRLAGGTDRPLPWEIVDGLDTRQVGRRAYYFDEIGSTQNYAVCLAESGCQGGSVVIAERQTHGRGRLQRRWESPEGGVWLSAVLRPKLSGTALSLIPVAVAVAFADAVKRTSGIDVRLKWPNDITIQSKKVAGIITDASLESNRLQYAVAGIGINFDVDAKSLEGRLKKTPNYYGVTSMARHGSIDRLEMIQALLEELEGRILQLEQGRTNGIIRDWIRRSETIQKTVSATVDGKKMTGTAEGMDLDGALIINTPGGKRRVLAEDITHLR